MDTVINRRYLKVVGSFPTHVCGSKNGSTDASYRRGCLFQGNDLYQSFQLCKLEKWKPTIISDEDAVFWTLLS
ncbi:unnamed protein product [Lathyrus oleraceus]